MPGNFLSISLEKGVVRNSLYCRQLDEKVDAALQNPPGSAACRSVSAVSRAGPQIWNLCRSRLSVCVWV